MTATAPVTRASAEWRIPPLEPTLSKDAVHVWRIGLDVEAPRLRQLEQHLSADERARSSRFRFAVDRERFLAARGFLRELLALYLDTAPRRLRFGQGDHGKPFVATERELRFNVSRSLDTMLVALAHGRELGVDVEQVHASLATEEIADTVLSAPERRALSAFKDEVRRTALLGLWTRKEALVKADGRGLSLPLAHIDVLRPDGSAAVLDEATGKWNASIRWRVHMLSLGRLQVGAVAAEGRDWQATCWRWGSRARNCVGSPTLRDQLPVSAGKA